MRRLLAITGAFVLLSACTLLWLAPATWLDAALQRGSRGALSLTDVQGRVWQGSGTLQAILPGAQVIAIDRLNWRVSARGLLDGRLHATVVSALTGKPVVDASLGIVGLTLHSSQLELPAALLEAFSPTLREAGLTGKLIISAREFRWERRQVSGAVDVAWNDATSSLVRINPLGSYRIEIKGETEGLGCRISTADQAALKLNGTCQQRPGQPFALNVMAEAGDNHLRELTPLLRIMGKEIRPGVYQLQVASGIGFDLR